MIYSIIFLNLVAIKKASLHGGGHGNAHTERYESIDGPVHPDVFPMK